MFSAIMPGLLGLLNTFAVPWIVEKYLITSDSEVIGMYLITFIKSFTTIFAPICGVIILDPGCGGYGFQFWKDCNKDTSALDLQVLDEPISIQDQCPGFWDVYDKSQCLHRLFVVLTPFIVMKVCVMTFIQPLGILVWFRFVNL